MSDDDYYNYESPDEIDYSSDAVGEYCLEWLTCARKKLNWENEEERYKFFLEFDFKAVGWYRYRPDLKEFFQPEEIEWLLIESVKKASHSGWKYNIPLVEMAFKTRYKDEPKVDEEGKPLLRRTTAMHLATQFHFRGEVIKQLFRIYDRLDLNYVDESGLTHFHAACVSGCDDVVEKFLELGEDPNQLWEKTGDSPLHLAVCNGNKEVTKLLLKSGTKPNLPNKQGETPLHLICMINDDEAATLLKIFFEISDEKQQTIQIDPVDKAGRTPLQWAVASLALDAIEILLNRGADLANFVFPTASYFGDGLSPKNNLELTSRTLMIVDRLKKRGYELDRNGALAIMKLFAEYEVFSETKGLEFWRSSKNFMKCSKYLMIRSDLSLCEFMQLRPDEAEKELAYSDYFEFASSSQFRYLSKNSIAECLAPVCEIMSSGFIRDWALEFVLELTRYRLPIPCCEMIIERLKNKDLMRLCLAAEIDVATEQNQMHEVHEKVDEIEELKNLHLTE